ncbi:hypothetical protein FOCC_FOCC013143 [Frankliniella occidentalis]|nr:hypothetical protein FOCC_FOCC013143 [Frankliniella occidentalis]
MGYMLYAINRLSFLTREKRPTRPIEIFSRARQLANFTEASLAINSSEVTIFRKISMIESFKGEVDDWCTTLTLPWINSCNTIEDIVQ